MSVEKRINARGAIAVHSKDARFFLRAQNGVYTITSVQNLSLTGVGIETRYPLALGEQIVLKYRYNDLQVSVAGSVSWCEPQPEQVYAIGIAFPPEEKARNSLFFLALHKYLEEFGPGSSGK